MGVLKKKQWEKTNETWVGPKTENYTNGECQGIFFGKGKVLGSLPGKQVRL